MGYHYCDGFFVPCSVCPITNRPFLQAAASSIDTTSPVYYEHIFVKSNRIFHQQQRAMEIERENQRLLKKMGDIHAVRGSQPGGGVRSIAATHHYAKEQRHDVSC